MPKSSFEKWAFNDAQRYKERLTIVRGGFEAFLADWACQQPRVIVVVDLSLILVSQQQSSYTHFFAFRFSLF